jgi:hypothetical protein
MVLAILIMLEPQKSSKVKRKRFQMRFRPYYIPFQQQALTFAVETHVLEVESLLHMKSGSHFNATNTRFGQVEELFGSRLTTHCESLSPQLLNLVGVIIDSKESKRRVGFNWSEEMEDTDVGFHDLGEKGVDNGRRRRKWNEGFTIPFYFSHLALNARETMIHDGRSRGVDGWHSLISRRTAKKVF